MAWKRSKQEVFEALNVQRQAIAASCKSYDEGNKWESLRLATAVYVVVHDGGKHSKSLLTQLGIMNGLQFVASGPPHEPKNLMPQTTIVSVKLSAGGHGSASAEYVPFLDEGPEKYRLIKFSKWWEREKIFVDGSHSLNRRRLVFTLRSQEGGAHFDAEQQNPNYERLARESFTTPRLMAGDESTPILGAELAMMRQIAWELMTTLDRANLTYPEEFRGS